MRALSDGMSPDAVLCGRRFLSNQGLLVDLVDAACRAYSWPDREEILSLVLDREAKMSTGIGLGIAVPHARLEGVDRVHVAVACVPEGVDFCAPDRKPVTLVMLLVSPMSGAMAHVQALALISRIAKTAVEQLSGAADPEQFIALLTQWELARKT